MTLERADGGGSVADARSLISLVSAGIGANEAVRLTATGDDAEAAVAAVARDQGVDDFYDARDDRLLWFQAGQPSAAASRTRYGILRIGVLR